MTWKTLKIGGKAKGDIAKMVNQRFLETAGRWKNDELPKEKTELDKKKSQSDFSGQEFYFPASPPESFIFSYDGVHGDYFQELIAKSNEKFRGTKAEIPTGKKGEVKNMYGVKRMALISTIVNNPNLLNYNLMPITPTQSENLLKEGKLTNPTKNWEDLGLILYDTNGENRNESIALKEDIVRHQSGLRLKSGDLEKRLVIINAGAEPDGNMNYGVRPVIVPGITAVYPHDILSQNGQDHQFEYGLDGGLPSVSQVGKGKRILYMPRGNGNIGLLALYRFRDLNLDAWNWDLDYSYDSGRVNFAPQGRDSGSSVFGQ